MFVVNTLVFIDPEIPLSGNPAFKILKKLSPVMREENVVTHEQLAFGCVGADFASVRLPLPQLWRSMVDHNLTGVALS